MLNFTFRLFSNLPMGFLMIVSKILAWINIYLIGYRKKVVTSNLKGTFPDMSENEIRALRHQFYHHFFEGFMEVIKGKSFSTDEWKRRVEFVGAEKLTDHLDSGRSVILMAGHVANWEWSGAATKAWTDRMLTVFFKEIKNEQFGKEMMKIRKSSGLNPVSKDLALRYLIKTKDTPQIIGMISDQIPAVGSEKYWMKWLNRESAFYQGAEKFSRAMKYPVYYADMRKKKSGFYQIEVKEVYDGSSELEEGHVMKKYSELLEETIRARPSDYLWSHKRWKYNKEEASEITGRPYLFIS